MINSGKYNNTRHSNVCSIWFISESIKLPITIHDIIYLQCNASTQRFNKKKLA